MVNMNYVFLFFLVMLLFRITKLNSNKKYVFNIIYISSILTILMIIISFYYFNKFGNLDVAKTLSLPVMIMFGAIKAVYLNKIKEINIRFISFILYDSIIMFFLSSLINQSFNIALWNINELKVFFVIFLLNCIVNYYSYKLTRT